MPTVATWIQQGSIWQIADWVPERFFGAGPGNGTVLVLSATLPWSNDFLGHLAIYPYVVLWRSRSMRSRASSARRARPAIAARADGHRRARDRPAGPHQQPARPGHVRDARDRASSSSIRHDRSEARADLVLAGLALGICFGTKFYGYTVVAAMVAIWVVREDRRAGRRRRGSSRELDRPRRARSSPAGGIWMLRNWVETGNPLLPLNVDPLGITLFEAPADPQRPLFGFTIADYLGDPGVWTDTLAHQFRIASGRPARRPPADHRRSRRRARAATAATGSPSPGSPPCSRPRSSTRSPPTPGSGRRATRAPPRSTSATGCRR